MLAFCWDCGGKKEEYGWGEGSFLFLFFEYFNIHIQFFQCVSTNCIQYSFCCSKCPIFGHHFFLWSSSYWHLYPLDLPHIVFNLFLVFWHNRTQHYFLLFPTLTPEPPFLKDPGSFSSEYLGTPIRALGVHVAIIYVQSLSVRQCFCRLKMH